LSSFHIPQLTLSPPPLLLRLSPIRQFSIHVIRSLAFGPGPPPSFLPHSYAMLHSNIVRALVLCVCDFLTRGHLFLPADVIAHSVGHGVHALLELVSSVVHVLQRLLVLTVLGLDGKLGHGEGAEAKDSQAADDCAGLHFGER